MKIFFTAVLFITQSCFGMTVDLKTTANKTEALESVRLHFLRSNPIDLTLLNADSSIAENSKFLYEVVSLVNRIGPKGKISVQTKNSKLIDDLKKQLKSNAFKDEVQLVHIETDLQRIAFLKSLQSEWLKQGNSTSIIYEGYASFVGSVLMSRGASFKKSYGEPIELAIEFYKDFFGFWIWMSLYLNFEKEHPEHGGFKTKALDRAFTQYSRDLIAKKMSESEFADLAFSSQVVDQKTLENEVQEIIRKSIAADVLHQSCASVLTASKPTP